jgi:hypothetical protein
VILDTVNEAHVKSSTGMSLEAQKKALEHQLGFLATQHWKVVDAALRAVLRRLLAAKTQHGIFVS